MEDCTVLSRLEPDSALYRLGERNKLYMLRMPQTVYQNLLDAEKFEKTTKETLISELSSWKTDSMTSKLRWT
jgi:hypothetical protein